MNSVTADSTAVMRIAALLDEGSFVEIGGAITARSTDFNLQNAPTPGDGLMVIWFMCTVRIRKCCMERSVRCMQKR